VAGGHAVVGRRLEAEQVPGLARDDRNRLDRRRAGADHGHALAAEVHAFVWPVSRVIPAARERLAPGDIRHLSIRQATGGHDAEPRADALAAPGLDRPPARRLLVDRARPSPRP